MIRLAIDRDGQRLGSIFVSGGLLSLQGPDAARLLDALAEVVAAVHGRDAARTLQDARGVDSESVKVQP